MDTVLEDIGDAVESAAEETFVLFSQDLPHNDLGILDDKSSTMKIEINGKEYVVQQSSTLLKSERSAGTTGAMMWKVTPRVADWLARLDSILWEKGIFDSSKSVVELGCGVAGLVGLVLSPLIASYILTDQIYALKLLKANIAGNAPLTNGRRKQTARRHQTEPSSHHRDNLHVVPLDWETDSVENLKVHLLSGSKIDVVILCDCIYNMFLVKPLTQTCVDICKMNTEGTTIVLVAQQLRTDEVFEEWLARFLEVFNVWRIKDDFLPPSLQSDSGYVVHLALLRGGQHA